MILLLGKFWKLKPSPLLLKLNQTALQPWKTRLGIISSNELSTPKQSGFKLAFLSHAPIPGVSSFNRNFTTSALQLAESKTGDENESSSAQTSAVTSKDSEKANTTASSSSDDSIHVGRLDFRVGRILEAKKHPDADLLYIETIDLGEKKPRTVVSGLVKHVTLEQMKDRLVVCLCNIKPAKMRGVESQAMLMCASSPDKKEMLEVDPSCKPGDVVSCAQFPRQPDGVLQLRKKIWETVSADLKISAEGLAVYKDQVLTIGERKHPMKAPTLRNVRVK